MKKRSEKKTKNKTKLKQQIQKNPLCLNSNIFQFDNKLIINSIYNIYIKIRCAIDTVMICHDVVRGMTYYIYHMIEYNHNKVSHDSTGVYFDNL